MDNGSPLLMLYKHAIFFHKDISSSGVLTAGGADGSPDLRVRGGYQAAVRTLQLILQMLRFLVFGPFGPPPSTQLIRFCSVGVLTTGGADGRSNLRVRGGHQTAGRPLQRGQRRQPLPGQHRGRGRW